MPQKQQYTDNQVIREVIAMLLATKHSFKSKRVEKARRMLEGLLSQDIRGVKGDDPDGKDLYKTRQH